MVAGMDKLVDPGSSPARRRSTWKVLVSMPRLICLLVILTPVAFAANQPACAYSEEADLLPPRRGGLKALTGPALIKMLGGQGMQPAGMIVGPIELFYEEGSYAVASEIMHSQGRYYAEGALLCIQVERRGTTCRHMARGDDDRLYSAPATKGGLRFHEVRLTPIPR
jgi:hypothetical protein